MADPASGLSLRQMQARGLLDASYDTPPQRPAVPAPPPRPAHEGDTPPRRGPHRDPGETRPDSAPQYATASDGSTVAALGGGRVYPGDKTSTGQSASPAGMPEWLRGAVIHAGAVSYGTGDAVAGRTRKTSKTSKKHKNR